MPDLEYDVKPVGQLRDDIEKASQKWPLAEGTVFEAVDCGGVSCEWISVPESKSDVVYLHAHGGGYYRGSSRVDAALCSHLCAMTGARCLSVNYRRPPDEGVFPAPVDDMFAVWQWLTGSNGAGVSPSKIVIGGTSAGGGLCLATLLRIRDEGQAMPAAALPVSPWADLTQSGVSFKTNETYGPKKSYLDHWAGVYLNGADAKHPYASPLFADLKGLPPLLIQVGGHETMLDDASMFAAAAARAGCAVTLEVYPEQPHSFQHDVGTKDISREAVEHMAQFLKRWTQ